MKRKNFNKEYGHIDLYKFLERKCFSFIGFFGMISIIGYLNNLKILLYIGGLMAFFLSLILVLINTD